MSGPPRVQGNLLVVAVVGITVAAVGYGTVYLPFYADKERLRGVRKDERRIPDVARKEIMAHLEKEEAYRREWESQLAPVAPPKQQQQQQLQQQSEISKTSEKPVADKPKSMWKMLDFSSKKQKQQPQYDENTPLWKVFEEKQRQTQKQEEEDAGIGSDDGQPAIRPDQMRLSDKARNQIIEAIKASEEEDRRQEILKAKKGKS